MFYYVIIIMSKLKKSQTLVYDDLEKKTKNKIQAFLDEKVPNPAGGLKGEKLIKSIVKHNGNDELGRQVVAFLKTLDITVGRALNGGDNIQFFAALPDDVHNAVVGKLWEHFAETGKEPEPYEPSTRAKSPPTKGQGVKYSEIPWSSDEDEGNPPPADPGRRMKDIFNEADDDSGFGAKGGKKGKTSHVDVNKGMTMKEIHALDDKEDVVPEVDPSPAVVNLPFYSPYSIPGLQKVQATFSIPKMSFGLPRIGNVDVHSFRIDSSDLIKYKKKHM